MKFARDENIIYAEGNNQVYSTVARPYIDKIMEVLKNKK
ncbi:hypothetical protein C2W64_01195 [Brevibacillus laterosporus]|nr:hypothetical protein C2W64_01195 [Brevibacillus laterosporus]